MQVPDSLAMFVQSAHLFLKNEIQIPCKDEVVRYMIVYKFERFSAAYTQYRTTPGEATRNAIIELLNVSEQQYNESERVKETMKGELEVLMKRVDKQA